MKKILAITLIVIFLIFVGLGLYRLKDKRSETINTDSVVNTLPSSWQSYKSQEFNYSISYPDGFEANQNGKNSIMISRKVAEKGQGASNFVYVSVIPEGSQGMDGEIYNFNKKHLDSLMSMGVGDKKTLEAGVPALNEYTIFERTLDTEISGNFAKTFINSKPWEFPAGTREYRFIVNQDKSTYLFGGYITTGEKNQYSIDETTFKKIISTLKLPVPPDSILMFETADNFYQRYLYCMKNPPEEAMGKVSEYCQNNTGLTTNSFQANIDKGGISKAGADPILCGQNPPEKVTVAKTLPAKNSALVIEKFGEMSIQITSVLKNIDGKWLIDNIVCPKP